MRNLTVSFMLLVADLFSVALAQPLVTESSGHARLNLLFPGARLNLNVLPIAAFLSALIP